MYRRILTPVIFIFLAGFTAGRAENVKDLAKSTKYLALGDSVAFGYTPLARKPGDLKDYSGYPDIVSKGAHLQVANASCFGETAGHFLNLSAPDTGCAGWRSMFPLFADYSGTQMDYAVDYLAQSKKAELVTIDLGINDLGLLLAACGGDSACFGAGAPLVLNTYGANLAAIFGRIRFVAGYTGPIVAVTIYSNTSDSTVAGPIGALNEVLTSVAPGFGVQIADAFTAFAVASAPFGGDSCAAGLLIPLPAGGCDIHPSAAGQALIAQTILDLLPSKK
ncbi:MAG TPA: SGNH/GDSL hydrolase family protein [Bryobacteraceae bacterium]|jgi:lysophospholipase L1-like esterase